MGKYYLVDEFDNVIGEVKEKDDYDDYSPREPSALEIEMEKFLRLRSQMLKAFDTNVKTIKEQVEQKAGNDAATYKKKLLNILRKNNPNVSQVELEKFLACFIAYNFPLATREYKQIPYSAVLGLNDNLVSIEKTKKVFSKTSAKAMADMHNKTIEIYFCIGVIVLTLFFLYSLFPIFSIIVVILSLLGIREFSKPYPSNEALLAKLQGEITDTLKQYKEWAALEKHNRYLYKIKQLGLSHSLSTTAAYLQKAKHITIPKCFMKNFK